MELTQEHRQQIDTIVAEMQRTKPTCQKDYQCYRSDLEDLCDIKGIGAFDEIKCDSEANRCCNSR